MIVEAEKTAVVTSIFFHEVLFPATGGIANLRRETIEPLKDKRVILIPDLSADDFLQRFTTYSGNLPELCAASAAFSNRLISQKWVFFFKYSLGIWEN